MHSGEMTKMWLVKPLTSLITFLHFAVKSCHVQHCGGVPSLRLSMCSDCHTNEPGSLGAGLVPCRPGFKAVLSPFATYGVRSGMACCEAIRGVPSMWNRMRYPQVKLTPVWGTMEMGEALVCGRSVGWEKYGWRICEGRMGALPEREGSVTLV